jgi:transposase
LATIVVQLEVNLEGRTLAEMEAELIGQLRGALGPAMEAEVAREAGKVEVGRCSQCGQPRRSRGWERRQVVGLFGTVAVRRQRVDCAHCQVSCYPADARLGLEPNERYTLGVAEAALWLAVDGSYAKSAASVRKLLGVPISANQVHRLGQREGELVQAAWDQLRQAVLDTGRREALAELEAAAPVKDP